MPLAERAAVAALALAALFARPAAAAAASGQLDDVVIKGQEKDEPSAGKPAFDVPFDPFETARPSLKPEESLLLAQSPSLTPWVAGHPRRLEDGGLIQPWNDALTELSRLELPLRASLGAEEKPAKDGRWALSIVDEDGKAVRVFEGRGEPPDSVAWDGKTDAGQWLRAGHAYSAVIRLRDAGAEAPVERTVLGRPIRFSGLVVDGPQGKVIDLDTSALFGDDRRAASVADAGLPLLRATADFVRRRAYRAPVSLRLFAPDVATGDAQASALRKALARELEQPPDGIIVQASAAPASEQRLELAVGGR